DESFARLHRAGWSAGDVRILTAEGPCYCLSAMDGETEVSMRGRTQIEACDRLSESEVIPVREKSMTNVRLAFAVLVASASASAAALPGHLRADNLTQDTPASVAIRQEGLADLQVKLAKRIPSAPARVMKSGGLAGAVGGARVKVPSADPQEVLLPIPQ